MVRRLAVANFAAGLYVLGYLSLIAPPPRHGSRVAIALIALASFAALSLAFAAVVLSQVRTRFAPEWAWLTESRQPTDRERDRVARQPVRVTMMLLALWLASAVVVAVPTRIGSGDSRYALAILAATALGGLTTAALSFLLVEDALRPLLAHALVDGPPEESMGIGLRPRLFLAWALGSGLPLVGALGTPAVYHRGVVTVTTATGFVAVVGLITGVRITWFEARSVARPLRRLQEAQARVQGGDLGAGVTVDDAGELGSVQHGFNQMVNGLRERQRLHDLFGRHVGEEVARAALARGTTLGGELHDASVLFVDLVGSTGLAREYDPQTVVALLNRVFTAVVDVVTAEGGWVNKFEGDAALCIFGPPASLSDHAGAALRSARNLQVHLAEITVDGVRSIDFGIGVASGTVVAGNVGAEQRFEYTVIGDPVNEAARLTEMAKAHDSRVLANEQAVHASAGELDRWRSVETVVLRGRDAPTAAYAPAS